MEGCWGAAYRDTSMQGDGDTWGCGDADTLGCKDTGMQGQSCRPARCHAGTAGALHLQRSPEHAGEAGDGEGGRAVGRLLTQAQLTQQLPHHRRQLEPVACGEERVAGGVQPPPWSQPALGCWGGGRAGCPRLPEKPAPMMMLLNLGCLSRMKSSSGVFWGSHGVRVWGPGSSPGPRVEGGRHGKVHPGVEEGLGPQTSGSRSSGGVSPCRGRSPPRPAGAPARAGSC